jgi:mRNA deadenylase 3'-5' endonuclease subunit Ccr4
MVIHSSLAMQITQEFAGDLPYIFAGDFNFMKESSCYKLYADGNIDSNDSTYPTLHILDQWKPTLKENVKSAYAEILNGEEPKFTNRAQHIGGDLFTGVLDYIFCSKSWKVMHVLETPDLTDASSVFPNENEPSDHVLIASMLKL